MNHRPSLPEFLPGQRIVVNTRSIDQAPQFRRLSESLNLSVFDFPCLEIVNQSLSSVGLSSLGAIDWLVFTSSNGVKSFVDSVRGQVPAAKIACIGVKTANAVIAAGYSVDFTGQEGNSRDFAGELIAHLTEGGKESVIHLIRGDLASDDLPEILRGAGLNVEQHIGYRSVLPKKPNIPVEVLQELILREPRTVLTFTSAQAIRNFFELLEQSILPISSNSSQGAELIQRVLSLPVVVIGPKTLATAQEFGFSSVVSATARSIESMLDAVVRV